jgi:hypothetical protein
MAKKTPSAWVKCVTDTYNQNKHIGGYKFKDAMRDAVKIYKKSKTIANVQSTTKVKRSKAARKTKKARK